MTELSGTSARLEVILGNVAKSVRNIALYSRWGKVGSDEIEHVQKAAEVCVEEFLRNMINDAHLLRFRFEWGKGSQACWLKKIKWEEATVVDRLGALTDDRG